MSKKLIVMIILLGVAAGGTAAFLNRALIFDTFRETSQPPLPDPVAHEAFEEVDEVDGVEEVEEVGEEQEVDEVEGVDGEEGGEEVEEVEGGEEVEGEDSAEADADLPASVNLAVPFTPQAPHADWELPYQEACEEASVYMVERYYAGTRAGLLAPDEADEEILKLVEYQESIFGEYQDTDARETSIFAEQFYGFSRVELIEDPTVERIKVELAAGRPVIVPAAGQQLGNPFFTGAGPRYHMLVIRGYTEDGFITNDPGTRRGEAFVYGFDTIMNAMHDWNDGNVEEGRKVVLVIHPEE